MDEITVNQSGDYSVYIEHKNGRMYVNGTGNTILNILLQVDYP